MVQGPSTIHVLLNIVEKVSEINKNYQLIKTFNCNKITRVTFHQLTTLRCLRLGGVCCHMNTSYDNTRNHVTDDEIFTNKHNEV